MRTWLSVPLMALLALGCSSSLVSQKDDGGQTTEELKRRVLELQRQTTVHELEIERLKKRLAELERNPEPSNPRDISSRPEPPRRDIPVETIEPPSLEESDLDAVSLGKPEPRHTGPPEPPPAAEEAPPQPAVEATPTVSADEQQAYDRGYTLYHQGRYLDAEGEFRQFLQAHPQSALADNAQYWIGESRYARKDVPGALAAFRETVERFPDGNKVPDALLKAGQCFEALGDRSAASETYRMVAERYPSSAAAARAEARLRSLE